MGARHQMFVIAKILQRYRTLAVVHHQFLSGGGPLKRCLRLLQIFQSESNRTPIQQELRTACEKTEHFWNGDDLQPFPFIATCLLVGSSFDPVKGYSRRAHPVAFNTTLDQVDNNEGLTFIDITYLDKIRYCFTFSTKMKPCSASQYLWPHSKSRNDEEEDEEEEEAEQEEEEEGDEESYLKGSEDFVVTRQQHPLAQQFVSYPLIDAGTLRSWSSQQLDEGQSSHIEEEQPANSHVTLRDQSMDRLLDTRLNDPGFDFSAFADAQQLPGFALKLRSKLHSLDKSHQILRSRHMIHLLQIAFSGESSVDFSPFADAAAECLVEAASKMLQTHPIKSLDLSHLRQLTEKDLETMIGTDSSLATLYILEMPQISLQCVARLWSRNPTLKDIYHTEMFQRPLAQGTRLSNLMPLLKAPPIMDLRNPIKNILWARMLTWDRTKRPMFRKADGITVDWQRSKLVTNSLQNGMFFSVFPIHDILLPQIKVINALINFLRCASMDPEACSYQDAYSSGFTMAKSFASASSGFKSPSPPAIGVLPDSIFQASSIAAKCISTSWPVSFPDMQPGDVSILIINEHDPIFQFRKSGKESNEEKFRLAIIRLESAGKRDKYHIESMDTYLANLANDPSCSLLQNEELVQLRRCWTEQMSFVQECDNEEIEELMSAAKIKTQRARKAPRWETLERVWNDFK